MKHVQLLALIILSQPAALFCSEVKSKRPKLIHKDVSSYYYIPHYAGQEHLVWQKTGEYDVDEVKYEKQGVGGQVLRIGRKLYRRDKLWWRKLLPYDVLFMNLKGLEDMIASSNELNLMKTFISSEQEYRIDAQRGKVVVYKAVKALLQGAEPHK